MFACRSDPYPFIQKPRREKVTCRLSLVTRRATFRRVTSDIPSQAHSQTLSQRNQSRFNEYLTPVTIPQDHLPLRRFFVEKSEERIPRGDHPCPPAVLVGEPRTDKISIDPCKFFMAVIPPEDERIKTAPLECTKILRISICARKRDDGKARFHTFTVPQRPPLPRTE